MNEYIGVVLICADEGGGKTTQALSFPTPLRHFDIDVGGYRRASWRINTEGMTSKGYPKPIQLSKLMGSILDEVTSRNIIPKKVEGMKELWQQIVFDFVAACQDEEVKSIVIDTSTMLWVICHSCYLQELQEKQFSQYDASKNGNRPWDDNMYRERLQPIEYGTPNDRMRTLFQIARSYSKNLILTHYPTDEYGGVADGRGNIVEGKTGKKVIDGFKESVKLADLVVWNKIVDREVNGINTKQVVSQITKCGLAGLGLSVVGMEMGASYESIINLRNLISPDVETASA